MGCHLVGRWWAVCCLFVVDVWIDSNAAGGSSGRALWHPLLDLVQDIHFGWRVCTVYDDRAPYVGRQPPGVRTND